MAKRGAHNEHSTGVISGSLLRNIILGGQDGLVNILGIVLGVAGATNDVRIVILTGLVATFAESISMGAVAYTSTKAAKSWYESKLAEEQKEIRTVPEEEKMEIKRIYAAKGFQGQLLNRIVQHITRDKKLWLDTMMAEELKLSKQAYASPLKDAFVVGFSSVVGSLVPLIPFFFLVNAFTGIWLSLVISTIVLFIVGAVKAKVTIGRPWKSGLELAAIGILAALAGYAVGKLVGVTF